MPLIGWILALALPVLLLLLLFLPLRLTLCAGERITLELKLGFLRLKRYPARKKKQRPPKNTRKKPKKSKKKDTVPSETVQKKRTLRQNIRRISAICKVLLRHTKKRLHLRAARLHVRVATGDAATTAIAFGAVSQSVAYLLALLDSTTKLKLSERNVSVEPDYLAERSSLDVKLVFTMRAWAFLATAFSLMLARMQATKRKPAHKKHSKSSSQKGN